MIGVIILGKQDWASSYLLIWSAAAEAKDEQMAVWVSAGKILPICWELAVKNSTMALALNLKTNIWWILT